jgi:hypothetical protein
MVGTPVLVVGFYVIGIGNAILTAWDVPFAETTKKRLNKNRNQTKNVEAQAGVKIE